MEDLISRQELANLLVVAQDEDFITLEEYDKFWDLVSRVPSADRPKGKWDYSDDMYETRVCSVCGFDTEDYKEYNFCPNCGADMRGDTE